MCAPLQNYKMKKQNQEGKIVNRLVGGSVECWVPFIVVVQAHLRGSLVHPQVSQAEKPAANPTPTDKPYFFCSFSSLGLGSLPADNSKGHTCCINDCSALPPVFTQPLYFTLYRLGTEKKLNLIKAKHDSKRAPALPTCHRNKRLAYPLSSCPAGSTPGHEKQVK